MCQKVYVQSTFSYRSGSILIEHFFVRSAKKQKSKKKIVHTLANTSSEAFQELCVIESKVYAKTMSVQTVLLDFSIEPSRLNDEVSRKELVKNLHNSLIEYFPELTLIFEAATGDGYLCIFSEKQIVLVNVRLFNQGLITINVEYYKSECEQQRLTFDVSITKQFLNCGVWLVGFFCQMKQLL